MAIKLETIENKDGFYATANLEDTLPQTAANYGIFFTACRPCYVLEIRQVHGTASSAGTVNVEKLTGTTAKGSGDDLLATAIDTSGTADTVQTFTARKLQNHTLNAGDRLAIVSGGTLTSMKDLNITVYLAPRGKGDYR